jgi:D-3-phosphoglycerate dehydrogenase
MTYRIFVTGAGLAEEALAYLEAEDCDVRLGEPRDTSADIARKLAEFDAEALIVRAGKITADVIQAAPNLRAICKHGVGTDNIDVAAAAARGIPVAYTPSANFESVAEHALALILALLRRVSLQDARIRRGTFEKRGYDGAELRGKTVGLVGFGRSARRLAELVSVFGVDTIAFHPSGVAGDQSGGVTKVQRVDDVLAGADIVSLHCPLTAATRHMIDERAIGRMRRGAYLVNTARGGLVNEEDLAQALRAGKLAGAALDVFESEPLAPDSPLIALEAVVLSPHVAGVSDGAFRTMGMESAQHVLTVLRGGMPPDDALVRVARA